MEGSGMLTEIEFWHWLILAAILAAIEIVAPGVFFIWLSGAAALTGIIFFFIAGAGWEIQGLVFAILATISVVGWHRFQRATVGDEPATTLNRRGEQLIGRVVSLSEPIVNGRGAAKVGDTVWRVEGQDMPAGSKVAVTGADGTILKVEAATK
jgi:membrane protein implicated in regulation of membrane protease activity